MCIHVSIGHWSCHADALHLCMQHGMDTIYMDSILSPWIWKGVSVTLQRGRYIPSYPSRRITCSTRTRSTCRYIIKALCNWGWSHQINLDWPAACNQQYNPVRTVTIDSGWRHNADDDRPAGFNALQGSSFCVISDATYGVISLIARHRLPSQCSGNNFQCPNATVWHK